jgi:hypothetical protein
MGLFGPIGSKQRVQLIPIPTAGVPIPNAAVIQFDASLKETHTRDSPPTEFPVENGQVISDHVIVKPFSLELTGIITDSPIGDVQALITQGVTSVVSKLVPPAGVVAAAAGFSLFSTIGSSNRPSVAAYQQLLGLQANAQPFDVLTSLYRYSSMWIKSISVPRDAETGDSLVFTLTCVQLLLVTPQSVNVQIFANPALSANQADLGQQGVGLPNGFTAGVTGGNSAIKAAGG